MAGDRAATVFNASHDGIVIIDEKMKIVTANKALSDLTGYSVDALTGKYLGREYSGLIQENLMDDIMQSLSTSGYWHGDTVEQKKTATWSLCKSASMP